MHLTLSRIVLSDFDTFLPFLLPAFVGTDMAQALFGADTRRNMLLARKTMLKEWHNDPADCWIKVVDEDVEVDVETLDADGNLTGTRRVKRTVGASNWKIYPTYVAPPDVPSVEEIVEKNLMEHLETKQERQDARAILTDFLTRRRRECKEGHVLLYLLFVDPSYQRKGVGQMLVGWGNEVADKLMLPSWVEASAKGYGLYRKNGYVYMEDVRVKSKSFDSTYTHLRRPMSVRGYIGNGLERMATAAP